MRYGLFSDVHANLPALTAVLAALESRGVDGYICAGDVVGYGPHPADCVDVVASVRPLAWVLGNHELMLLGRLSIAEAPPLVQKTLAWTHSVLPDDTVKRLGSLPLCAAVDGGVIVAHGSLSDAAYRVTRHPQMVAELERLETRHPDAWVLVLGHTHRVIVADCECELRWAVARRNVRLRPDTRYIVNPGSVGQARGFVGHARAAVLDTEARTLELVALRYEKSSLERDLRRVGFPTWTHHRSPIRRALERLERKARALRRSRSARLVT